MLGVDGHLGLALTADGKAELALVHWEPDEDRKRRDISIEAARSVIGRLALSSHYGGDRFVIIESADLLNASSANALLKTIEEPPAGMHLLLVTERPQALLPTLRSRCQKVRFARPAEAEAQAWMEAQGVRDADALRLALGAPLRALTLRDNDGIAIRRQWAEIWAAVAAGRKDPLTAAAAISKDLLAEHLQWVQQWLGEQLRELLLQAAPQRRCEALAHMQQDVVDAQRRAAGNAQAQLLMESLFVRWLRLSRAAAQTPAAAR